MVTLEKGSFPKVGQIAHMGVTTASASTNIEEAIQMMLEYDLRDVIFEVDAKHYIFTSSDLLAYSKQSDDFSVSLASLPPHPLRKVDENESVMNAFSDFEGAEDRYLGVSNGLGDLVGVLSYSDVISALDPSVFIQKKTVGEVLSPQHRFAVSADTPARDVLEYLNDVENAVIIVEDDRPLGILTAKDVLRIIQKRWDTDQAVSNYMISPVDLVSSSRTISEVMTYLQKVGFKRAVIVDQDKKLLGVLTQSDLAGFAFSHWTENIQSHTKELSETADMLANKAKAYEQDANTDPLTSIGNRRYFNCVCDLEIARAKRYKSSIFSVIMIDIDFFKKVNDVHGHLKGDEILKALSSAVQNLLREMDIFCRWGGEEFVILVPETEVVGAQILAERIRELLAQNTVHEIAFTISAGVGEYRPKDNMESLLKRVDTALYRAKENGRNRVELAQ